MSNIFASPEYRAALARNSGYGSSPLDNPLLTAADAARVGRPRQQTPMPEEEEQQAAPEERTFLGATRDVGLSALAGAGNLLDLPGSSVRDIFAGKNPADQWLTPFSDANRTTGRDLNRMYGLSGKDDTWQNFWGGLGTEIILDPTSYFGVGLLSKAVKGVGKASKAAGLTKGIKSKVNKSLARQAEAAKTAMPDVLPMSNELTEAAAKVTKQSPEELGYWQALTRATPGALINSADDPVKELANFYRVGGTDEMLNKPIYSIASAELPIAQWIPGLKNTRLGKTAELVTKKPVIEAIDESIKRKAKDMLSAEAALEAAKAESKVSDIAKAAGVAAAQAADQIPTTQVAKESLDESLANETIAATGDQPKQIATKQDTPPTSQPIEVATENTPGMFNAKDFLKAAKGQDILQGISETPEVAGMMNYILKQAKSKSGSSSISLNHINEIVDELGRQGNPRGITKDAYAELLGKVSLAFIRANDSMLDAGKQTAQSTPASAINAAGMFSSEDFFNLAVGQQVLKGITKDPTVSDAVYELMNDILDAAEIKSKSKSVSLDDIESSIADLGDKSPPSGISKDDYDDLLGKANEAFYYANQTLLNTAKQQPVAPKVVPGKKNAIKAADNASSPAASDTATTQTPTSGVTATELPKSDSDTVLSKLQEHVSNNLDSPWTTIGTIKLGGKGSVSKTNDAIQALVDNNSIAVAYDAKGKTHYSTPGSPLPAWLTDNLDNVDSLPTKSKAQRTAANSAKQSAKVADDATSTASTTNTQPVESVDNFTTQTTQTSTPPSTIIPGESSVVASSPKTTKASGKAAKTKSVPTPEVIKVLDDVISKANDTANENDITDAVDALAKYLDKYKTAVPDLAIREAQLTELSLKAASNVRAKRPVTEEIADQADALNNPSGTKQATDAADATPSTPRKEPDNIIDAAMYSDENGQPFDVLQWVGKGAKNTTKASPSASAANQTPTSPLQQIDESNPLTQTAKGNENVGREVQEADTVSANQGSQRPEGSGSMDRTQETGQGSLPEESGARAQAQIRGMEFKPVVVAGKIDVAQTDAAFSAISEGHANLNKRLTEMVDKGLIEKSDKLFIQGFFATSDLRNMPDFSVSVLDERSLRKIRRNTAGAIVRRARNADGSITENKEPYAVFIRKDDVTFSTKPHTVIHELAHGIFYELEREDNALFQAAVKGVLKLIDNGTIKRYFEDTEIDKNLANYLSESPHEVLAQMLVHVSAEAAQKMDPNLYRLIADVWQRINDYISKFLQLRRYNEYDENLDTIKDLVRYSAGFIDQGKREEILTRLNTLGAGIKGEYTNPNVFHSAVAGAGKTETSFAQQEWIEKGVRSSFFKRWFGDWESDATNASKVVDPQGKPLVVYHGTARAGFSEFTPGDPSNGIYFTSSPEVAASYSGASKSSNIIPVYLDAKNPLTIDADGGWWGDLSKARVLNSDGSATAFTVEKLFGFSSSFTDKLSAAVRKSGFDSIIIKNVFDQGAKAKTSLPTSDVYIVFDSTQVKSATGNIGSFTIGEPDIRLMATKPTLTLKQKMAQGTQAAKSLTDTVGNWISQSGSLGDKITEALDAGTNILFGFPAVRATVGLFDAAVMGVTSSLKAQDEARLVYEVIQSAIHEANGAITPLVRAIEGSKYFDVANIKKTLEVTQEEAENIANQRAIQLRAAAEGIDSMFYKNNELPEEIRSVATVINKLYDDALELEAYKAGLDVQRIKDEFAEYTFRESRKPGKQGATRNPFSGPQFDTRFPSQLGRKEFLTNLPAGTGVIDELSLDNRISGLVNRVPVKAQNRKAAEAFPENIAFVVDDKGVKTVNPLNLPQLRQHLHDNYGPKLDGEYFDYTQKTFESMLADNPQATWKDAWDSVRKELKENEVDFDAGSDKRYDSMINWLVNLDAGYIRENQPIFGRNLLHDTMMRVEDGLKASSIGMLAQKLIGKSLSKFDGNLTVEQLEKREVAWKDTMKSFRMDTHVGHQNIINNMSKASQLECEADLQARVEELYDSIHNLLTNPKKTVDPEKPVTVPRSSVQYAVLDQVDAPFGNGKRTIEKRNQIKYQVHFDEEAGDKKLYRVVNDELEEASLDFTNPANKDEILNQLSREYKQANNLAFLTKHHIPEELHNDITRWMKPFSSPEEIRIFRDVADSFSNVFRANVTGPFPSFHGRNLISATIQNIIYRAFDPSGFGPWRYIKPMLDARKMRKGESIDGIYDSIAKNAGSPYVNGLVTAEDFDKFKQTQIKVLMIQSADARSANNLTLANELEKRIKEIHQLSNSDPAFRDLVTTQKLADLAFKYGVTGAKQGQSAEVIGDTYNALASRMPGLEKTSALDLLKGKLPEAPADATLLDALNPLAVQGGMSLTGKKYAADYFLGTRAGRLVSKSVEDTVRLAPFIAYIKQGYLPEVAAEMVNHNQIDYSRLSSFERKYARTLFPFWTYSSRILATTAKDLIQNPGGRQAQLIRAINVARDQDAMAPEYIQSSASIPLGRLPDGSDRYITGFGLGVEDAAKFSKILQGDLYGTVRELYSRSNPLAKLVGEMAFGRSAFYDGPEGAQQISDLDPPIGRTWSNIRDLVTGERTERPSPFISQGFEHVMSNSPLARYGTYARQLTDPRKLESPWASALDLLTGIKIKDVSPAAQDSIAVQRAGMKFKELGGRNQSIPFMPKDKLEELSPQDRESVESIQQLLKEVKERRKARRELEEARVNEVR